MCFEDLVFGWTYLDAGSKSARPAQQNETWISSPSGSIEVQVPGRAPDGPTFSKVTASFAIPGF